MKRIIFGAVLLALSLMPGIGSMAAAAGEELSGREADSTERLTLDSINGIYIPKDLEDCFVQLDTLLSAEDKEVIKKLERSGETIRFHHGLGMWLRNNWGLWTGSRLQKYFMDKGFRQPDDMSALILGYYYDWLNGRHEAWQEWVRNRAGGANH